MPGVIRYMSDRERQALSVSRTIDSLREALLKAHRTMSHEDLEAFKIRIDALVQRTRELNRYAREGFVLAHLRAQQELFPGVKPPRLLYCEDCAYFFFPGESCPGCGLG